MYINVIHVSYCPYNLKCIDTDYTYMYMYMYLHVVHYSILYVHVHVHIKCILNLYSLFHFPFIFYLLSLSPLSVILEQ